MEDRFAPHEVMQMRKIEINVSKNPCFMAAANDSGLAMASSPLVLVHQYKRLQLVMIFDYRTQTTTYIQGKLF